MDLEISELSELIHKQEWTKLVDLLANGQLANKQDGLNQAITINGQNYPSVLFWAVKYKKLGLVNALLAYQHLDVNIKDDCQQSALTMAILNRDLKTIKMLFQHKSLNATSFEQDKSQYNAFGHAHNQGIDIINLMNTGLRLRFDQQSVHVFDDEKSQISNLTSNNKAVLNFIQTYTNKIELEPIEKIMQKLKTKYPEMSEYFDKVLARAGPKKNELSYSPFEIENKEYSLGQLIECVWLACSDETRRVDLRARSKQEISAEREKLFLQAIKDCCDASDKGFSCLPGSITFFVRALIDSHPFANLNASLWYDSDDPVQLLKDIGHVYFSRLEPNLQAEILELNQIYLDKDLDIEEYPRLVKFYQDLQTELLNKCKLLAPEILALPIIQASLSTENIVYLGLDNFNQDLNEFNKLIEFEMDTKYVEILEHVNSYQVIDPLQLDLVINDLVKKKKSLEELKLSFGEINSLRLNNQISTIDTKLQKLIKDYCQNICNSPERLALLSNFEKSSLIPNNSQMQNIMQELILNWKTADLPSYLSNNKSKLELDELLYSATASGLEENFILIINKFKLEDLQSINFDQLMLAATEGNNLQIVKKVENLAKKMQVELNVNAEDNYGNSLLNVAVRNGNLHLVKHLLSNQADPDVELRQTGQQSCLEIAIRNSDLNMTKLLLDYNVSFVNASLSGKSPMKVAEYIGNIPMINMMKNFGEAFEPTASTEFQYLYIEKCIETQNVGRLKNLLNRFTENHQFYDPELIDKIIKKYVLSKEMHALLMRYVVWNSKAYAFDVLAKNNYQLFDMSIDELLVLCKDQAALKALYPSNNKVAKVKNLFVIESKTREVQFRELVAKVASIESNHSLEDVQKCEALHKSVTQTIGKINAEKNKSSRFKIVLVGLLGKLERMILVDKKHIYQPLAMGNKESSQVKKNGLVL